MFYHIFVLGDISQAPAPEPEPVKPSTPVVAGKYVPPSLRAGGAATMSSAQKPRRKKEAPNIKSNLDFPELGGMSGKGPGAE